MTKTNKTTTTRKTTTKAQSKAAAALVTKAPEKTTEQPAAFVSLMSDFENTYKVGGDYAAPLYSLSRAIVFACLRKVIDPQRKAAQERDTVSNSGISPALVALRRGVVHDMHLLDNTAAAVTAAFSTRYNANGDLVTETVDPKAAAALVDLLGDTLSDGMDLVQDCALAILEQAAEHAAAPGWLVTPYTVRRLAKKVYIRQEESAAYREEETTPIQEVYRAVRRSIEQSRAVKTDPANGYIYIEEETPDGLDTIFHRLGKVAAIDGNTTTTTDRRPGDYIPGQPTDRRPAEPVTVDAAAVTGLSALLDLLDLSANQRRIVELRLRNYGQKAIATYLGVSKQAVQNALAKIQRKAAALGLNVPTK